MKFQPGLFGAVGSVSDARARGPKFNTRSGHMLSFLLLLVQEGQLPVTGESMCTKYWLPILFLKIRTPKELGQA